jgi:hypothetical protein
MSTVSTKFATSAAIVVLAATFMAGSAFAGKGQTFTGTVSDAMCGAKHAMPGDDAGCTRACVSKGSKYALVVNDKVYTLEADETGRAELDKMAGQKVTVSGTAKGDTIDVTSVSAAK